MSMDFRDRARGWIDDARYEIKKFFKRMVTKEVDEEQKRYEARWVWYHSALVIELGIIIILLWYIAI